MSEDELVQFTEFLMFCLSSAGMTLVLVVSDIAEPLRRFLSRSLWAEKLINCSMCTGVWVGAFLSLYFEISPVIGAFITSVVSWSIHNIVDAADSIAANLDEPVNLYEEEE
jgi:flagellar biosynthesis protein FliR